MNSATLARPAAFVARAALFPALPVVAACLLRRARVDAFVVYALVALAQSLAVTVRRTTRGLAYNSKILYVSTALFPRLAPGLALAFDARLAIVHGAVPVSVAAGPIFANPATAGLTRAFWACLALAFDTFLAQSRVAIRISFARAVVALSVHAAERRAAALPSAAGLSFVAAVREDASVIESRTAKLICRTRFVWAADGRAKFAVAPFTAQAIRTGPIGRAAGFDLAISITTIKGTIIHANVVDASFAFRIIALGVLDAARRRLALFSTEDFPRRATDQVIARRLRLGLGTTTVHRAYLTRRAAVLRSNLPARSITGAAGSVDAVKITRDAKTVKIALLAFGGVALVVLYATRGSPALTAAAHLPFATTSGNNNSIDGLLAAGTLRAAKSKGARVLSGRATVAPSVCVWVTTLIFFAACTAATFLSFSATTYAISVDTVEAFQTTTDRSWAATRLLRAIMSFLKLAEATERTFFHVPVAHAVEAYLARAAVVRSRAARGFFANPVAADLVSLARINAFSFEAGLALARIAVGIVLAARQGLAGVVLAALVAFAYANALVLRHPTRKGRDATVVAYLTFAAVVVSCAAGRGTTLPIAAICVESIAKRHAAAAFATCVALRTVELRFAARDPSHALAPAAGLIGLALANARAVAALLARSAFAVGFTAFFLTSAVAALLPLRALVFALSFDA